MKPASRSPAGVSAGVSAAFLAAAFVLLASAVGAQGRQRGMPSGAMRADDRRFTVHNVPYDGRFTFVRLAFNPMVYARGRGDGQGGGFFGGIDYFWDHDYPRADQHVTTIVRELTTVLTAAGSNVLWIGSPEIFRYPLAYVSEPGYWTQSDEEAANLRAYLQKGGFLIFDDFAGGQALQNLEREMARVIPGGRLVEIPASHPIFNSFFQVDPATAHSGYGTTAYFLGMFEDNDPTKRLLLVANFNNDIGESWEWSDTGYIAIDITNEAYKLGINYFIYALTR